MQGPRHGAQTLALLGHHHHRRPFFGRPLFVVLGHHNTYKCRGVAFDSRLRRVKERFDGDLEVVKKKKRAKGFHVLPRRWVVERTFAWLGRSRRLSKDYERNPLASESQVYCASARLLLRQITDNQIQYKLSNCEFSA